MRVMKTITLGLGAALLMGLSLTSFAGAPCAFVVHNQSRVASTVEVDGKQSPFIVDKRQTRHIPWDAVEKLCGNVNICNAEVIGVNKKGKPKSDIAAVALNTHSGEIVSVEMKDDHFTVHVDGIAEVTLANSK